MEGEIGPAMFEHACKAGLEGIVSKQFRLPQAAEWVWRARDIPDKSGRVWLLCSYDLSLFPYSSLLAFRADYRGNLGMTAHEYYLKQSQIAVGLTLAEPDLAKAARFSLLALEHFDKAEKAKAETRWSPRTILH